MKRSLIITVFVFIFCLYGVSHAEMYQWVDEDGVVHFSDTQGDSDSKELIETQESNDPAQYDQYEELERTTDSYNQAVDEYNQQDARDRYEWELQQEEVRRDERNAERMRKEEEREERRQQRELDREYYRHVRHHNY